MQLFLRCECLLDQDYYIGSDPVGHSCYHDAVMEMPQGFCICKECYCLLLFNPDRVTTPVFPAGIAGQEKVMDEILTDLFMKSKTRNPELVVQWPYTRGKSWT